MTNILLLFLVIFFSYLLRDWCLKRNLLLNYTGDKHQKFFQNKRVPLIGGLLIVLFLIFQNLDLLQKIYIILVCLIGFLSDIKFLKSPKYRFILQFISVLTFLYLSETFIQDTRIIFLDRLLENKILSLLFTAFCILIIINGSNFIDGTNGNLILNTLLIIFGLIYISYNYSLEIDYNLFLSLIVLLFIVLILNFKNLIFLGDNGSCVIGFFVSIILVNFYIQNNFLSPFLIVLWLFYPGFENLFSILRKYNFDISPLKADTRHLHHLLYYYLSKKFKKIKNNMFSSLVIMFFNAVFILLSIQYPQNTQYQIFLIVIATILYSTTYYKLNIFYDRENRNRK